MRHKYITRYDPEHWDEFFHELKKSGFVAEEYSYPDCAKNRKNTAVGTILLVTDKGRKFFAIASNTGRKITQYQRGRTRTVRTCTMYRLTDEGAQYIKECIVEDRV